ncbi:MAG: PstS family phosphate ABC transporter substrate-binding protein [Chloroflexi bacterium]|nr:PstS family phosphate ABC transporter substrate-binding protein [Chloroflexota bacterium]
MSVGPLSIPDHLKIGLLSLPVLVTACGGQPRGGLIEVDGSSTVFPITEAVAEEFQKVNPAVRVTVGISGTGGGFKRFCAGEIDISDASRPIQDSEIEACRAAGVEFIELKVAFDGLSVMVNPGNDFVGCLSMGQLKAIWEPGSTVRLWSDIEPSWPAEEIHLYGPGTDSGTFDYFTAEIVGEEDASRADYTASEDDNVLAQGIAGDAQALGYFGFAYYEQNSSRLQLVAIDGGRGCMLPSRETILNGSYMPLSRPLYIYVKVASLARPEVAEFVRFYVQNATTLVPQVGYVELPQAEYDAGLRALEEALR